MGREDWGAGDGRRNRAVLAVGGEGRGWGGLRETRPAQWNLGSSIKIYRCWDSMDSRHYSW